MLCVRAHVYVSMLIHGRALPNTPWKHSIHQQLEPGALGPALHLHWERGRQRRGGKRRRGEERRRIWGYHGDERRCITLPCGIRGLYGVFSQIDKYVYSEVIVLVSPNSVDLNKVIKKSLKCRPSTTPLILIWEIWPVNKTKIKTYLLI